MSNLIDKQKLLDFLKEKIEKTCLIGKMKYRIGNIKVSDEYYNHMRSLMYVRDLIVMNKFDYHSDFDFEKEVNEFNDNSSPNTLGESIDKLTRTITELIKRV